MARKGKGIANFNNVAKNSDIKKPNNINSDINTDGKESIEDVLNGKRKSKTETHTFKGFWLENDIANVIDDHTGKVKGDKSDLVNHILNKYFIDNGYM